MEKDSEDFKIQAKANILLFVVLSANFFRYIGVSIIQIGLPEFILNLSGSLISYGLVIGVFNITQAIFQFPIAAASDKFGRKAMIVIGLFIYIIGTFLCYFAQNITELIIFRAMQGAGAYSSILQAILGDMYQKEKKGKGMALYSFSLTIGYFAGTVIGGYVSFYLGFRSIFLITGILAIVSVISIIIFLKLPKKSMENKSENIYAESEESSSTTSNIKILLKEHQYQFSVLINSIRWLIFGGIISYLTWLLQIHFKLNQIESSYVLIVTIAIYTIFLLYTGKLVDRHGPKKMLLIGQIIIMIFGFLFFIVQITNNLLIFIIASLINSIGLGVLQTSGNTLIQQKIEDINPDLKGSGFGMANTVGFICSAVGPVLLSFLGEIETFLPYYFIMILMLPAFLITLKFIKN